MPRTRFCDLEGQKFGRLIVLGRASEEKKGPVMWRVVCDCGTEKLVASPNLVNGSTKSCGCFRKESTSKKFKTHGLHGSPTWYSWTSMKTRCKNPKATQYELYGGRGIQVCERWEKFENFLEDMGERPPGKSLDRIDANGNYEPSNCRWATKKEQGQNKRKTRMINKDSLMKFLKTQEYLTESQREKIINNFFNF